MNPRNFFAELKRRNVYKVAVAYAVVGWLVVQIASTVLPTFHSPEWALQTLVVIVALGFPIALIIAWAFESTPEGIKRTAPADASPNNSSRGRTWIYVVVIGGALSVGLFFLGRFSAANKQSGSAEVSSKSIAVLPFENLSEEKSNAYFAEGIQDEILTRLSKIGTLKVISRTSTAHYASSPQNLPEIAKQLGVANILEGSVQKVNDAVRINVQLIRAATDDHLWAESYDRKLRDIFGVEAEVAQNIASTLNARLTGAEQKMLAQRPTTNAEAYEAYLRGSAQLPTINPEPERNAIQSFSEAVRLDPQFALAWAALASAHSQLFFMAESTPAHRQAAQEALAEARRLQPDLPETQLARAFFQYYVENDKKGARDLLLQLLSIWPNNAEMLWLLGAVSARLGDWGGSLDYYNQAIAVNPRDPFLRATAAQTPFATRDFTTALKMVDEGLQIWPEDDELLGAKASVFQNLGRLDEAQPIVDRLKPNTRGRGAIFAIFSQAWLRRNPTSALPFFQTQAKRAEGIDASWSLLNTSLVAELERLAGDSVGAQKSFAKMRDRVQSALQEEPNSSDLLSFLAEALAGLGERAEALRALDQASALRKDDARVHPIFEETRARFLARFGEKDEAIAILQKLLVIPYDGAITPALLRLDPDFDNLRSDPRFEKLCQEKTQ